MDADSGTTTKAELLAMVVDNMQVLAGEAAAVAERTERAAELAIKARECAELYAGMFKSEPHPSDAYGPDAPKTASSD